jgi:hypothetical protein
MNRTLAVLIGASTLLNGCVGVPPAANPTVEVWDMQPTANTDVADAIVEQVISLASSVLDDSSAEPTERESSCLFWCFHGRGATPLRPAPQPVAGPLVYQYTSYSAPARPLARVTNTAQAPAIKPTPRPVHIAASKPAAPKAHTPAAKPSTPKPPKPAASSASNKKTDKR